LRTSLHVFSDQVRDGTIAELVSQRKGKVLAVDILMIDEGARALDFAGDAHAQLLRHRHAEVTGDHLLRMAAYHGRQLRAELAIRLFGDDAEDATHTGLPEQHARRSLEHFDA